MATEGKNLSAYEKSSVPSGKYMTIGVVVSEWNEEITNGLLEGATQTLLENGVTPENLIVKWVPGSFELPLGAQYLFEEIDVDGIVCLGSVVQGETKHFDFVCEGTTKGVMDVSLKYNKPVIFGLLTDNTFQQGLDRSGGKHGNKGVECAVACLKMIALKRSL